MNVTVPFLEKRFDYDEGDVGRTVRCRYCHKLMKLVKAKEEVSS